MIPQHQYEENMIPQHQYEAALAILKKHYHNLLRDMAHEVILYRKDFDGGDSRVADEIVAKHAARLRGLRTIYNDLAHHVATELPQATEPLGKDEFRCFSCGSVIRRGDHGCKLCGWTWL